MAEWPIQLPRQSSAGEISAEPALLRTEMEVGPPKVRLRTTKERVLVRFAQVPFTVDQWERFEEFWREDLGGGALTFDWEHPVTSEVVEYRFTEKPRFQSFGGGDGRRLFTTLNLEIV